MAVVSISIATFDDTSRTVIDLVEILFVSQKRISRASVHASTPMIFEATFTTIDSFRRQQYAG